MGTHFKHCHLMGVEKLQENHVTLESLYHPFDAKKYYSLPIWRIDNMTMIDESAGAK